jgi:elongation factor 1 alpha-like protein
LLCRYKKQATELNKSSFALAWVMDTGSEERERGVTVDIAQHPFHTDKMDFTILDAPGHRDFVPNMLAGASMADLALLVVDANQLESGMKGQTREHILLAKACGLKRVVVAVNKLDATVPKAWDANAFETVKKEVGKLLADVGFKDDDLSFVPVSGLSGVNVVKPTPSSGETAWVSKTAPTLLQQLERAPPSGPSEDSVKEPLRMQITDVFRGSITNPLSVSGRLTSGNIQIGDTVLIQPSGEKANIRGLEISGEAQEWTVSGDLCTIHLSDIDPMHLRAGDVVCSANKPVSVVKNFIAKVEALESLLPQSVDVHVGRLHVPGTLAALISVINSKGEVVRKKPRVVKEGEVANVKVALVDGTPLAVGDRVVVRSAGNTVAAGRVERVGASSSS